MFQFAAEVPCGVKCGGAVAILGVWLVAAAPARPAAFRLLELDGVG